MNKEKQKFILGIISGLAIISLVCLAVLAAIYLRGNINTYANKTDDSSQNKIAQKTTPQKPQKAEIEISDNDHTKGNPDAKVTIVEFSDIQCPYCAKLHNALREVMGDGYEKKVFWVYKHFPLSSHRFSTQAAVATECAGEQGKFWEYLDNLFENQNSLSSDYFTKEAKNLKLDEEKFSSCLLSDKYLDKVRDDYELGQALGVKVTPTSFINGQEVKGAIPASQIKSIIESAQ